MLSVGIGACHIALIRRTTVKLPPAVDLMSSKEIYNRRYLISVERGGLHIAVTQ